MKNNQFKHIVGEVTPHGNCDIRLFGEIDEWTAQSFVNEFLWLEDMSPKKINIHINSVGGEVVSAMSIYSMIANCQYPTICINEGLAASAASIIWAASDKSMMRDYAILMIHNPFTEPDEEEEEDPDDGCKKKCETDDGCKKECECDDPDDGCKTKDEDPALKAFRTQIETIYEKRFGLSKEEVQNIMNGKGDSDGTFFNADEAVKAGIIPEENVIKTTKQTSEIVKNEIKGVKNAKILQNKFTSIYNKVCSEIPMNEENKLSEATNPNLNKINNNFFDNKSKTNMENKDNTIEFNFGAVVASLGFKDKADVNQVMNRISELVGKEKEIESLKQTVNTLTVEKAGETAKYNQVNDELTKAKNQLQVYLDKDKQEFEAKVTALIEDAVTNGKITAESKDSWTSMATENFELVQNTLNSIPAKDKLSTEIENEPGNVSQTIKQMQDKVDAVVGKDFKFGTF